MSAIGIAAVASDKRVECHAPSGYTQRDYSGKAQENKRTGTITPAARARKEEEFLMFWQDMGVARWVSGGGRYMERGDRGFKAGGGHWEFRVSFTGEDATDWVRKADLMSNEGRADRAEFSHIYASENGGAWCPCNCIAERGSVNAARGEANMTGVPLEWQEVLAQWPAWWARYRATGAALKRLGM